MSTGRTAWKREQRAGATSLVATGGGLLFGGDTNGRFRALDQRTGEVLWEVNLGSHVSGFPVTFAVERQAVRRREHRRHAEHDGPRDAHARAARGQRQQSLRVRAAGLRSGVGASYRALHARATERRRHRTEMQRAGELAVRAERGLVLDVTLIAVEHHVVAPLRARSTRPCRPARSDRTLPACTYRSARRRSARACIAPRSDCRPPSS